MSSPRPSSAEKEDGDDSISEPASITSQFANVVRPFGYSSMECGYCKGTRASLVGKTPLDSSKSYGVLAEKFTPEAYEGLLHRGWRRSGIHLYKPSNFESCCPSLTIRCDTHRFVPTKSQLKITHKLKQLLRHPSPISTARSSSNHTNNPQKWDSYLRQSAPSILSQLQEVTRLAIVESQLLPPHHDMPSILYKARPPSKAKERNKVIVLACNICAKLAGMNKIPKDPLVKIVVAKLLQANIDRVVSVDEHAQSGNILVTLKLEDSTQQQRKMDKSESHMSLDVDDGPPPLDKLGDWYLQTIGKPLRGDQRELVIHTLPSHQSALNPKVHELYVQYQHLVHGDADPLQATEESAVTRTAAVNGENATLEEEPPAVDPIKEVPGLDWGSRCPPQFKENVSEMLQSYLAPYPTHVQRALLDNFISFYQFLVESPFSSNSTTIAALEGSYHQQYWIGDALIAVGVVDVLPQGLSSVYLYYHPGMSHSLVALGKLATLKEIAYTRDVLKKPYYFLGYFIESCPKMRYKADYHPSQLLCPARYHWVDCERAIPKLQSTALQVCALVEGVGDDEDSPLLDSELVQIPMDIGAGIPVTLDMLHENGRNVVRPILQEFSLEAGPEMSRKCLLKLA